VGKKVNRPVGGEKGQGKKTDPLEIEKKTDIGDLERKG